MNSSEVMIANILGDRLLMTYATSVQVHARAGVIVSLGAVCVRVIRVIFCPKISNVLLKVTVVSWWDYLVRLSGETTSSKPNGVYRLRDAPCQGQRSSPASAL